MQEPAVETDHQHCWHVQQKMAYCDQKAEKIEKIELSLNIFTTFINWGLLREPPSRYARRVFGPEP